MASFSSFKQNPVWRAEWFAGVLIVAAVVALHITTDFIGPLERRFYDVASTSTSRQPSDAIAVIAIDEQSLASIGPWPWSRDIHARLIDQLAAAKARTIVHTGFFFEPQAERGLGFIRTMKDVLGASGEASGAASTTHAQLARLIAESEVALDTDSQLAESFHKAANVIIPSFFVPGRQPIQSLAAAAAGVGRLSPFQDVDGIVRREPLLVNYHGKVEPSLALLAAVKSLNLTAADIKLHGGEALRTERLRIETDGAGLMLAQFYKGRNGQPAFALDSFDEVLAGKIPAAKYADKIVVIGVTAASVGTHFAVPGNSALSVTEIMAHMTSGILSGHFITQPGWAIWVTLGLVLVVAAYVVTALPRLSAGPAAVGTGLFLVTLLTVEFGLLCVMAVWLQLLFPATLLVAGYLAITTKRLLRPAASKRKSVQESAETNRMMGLALQGQGQLDMALDRLRRVPMSDAVMGDWHSLALDFERKQQFNKAELMYEHMAAYNKDYKDLKTPEKRGGKPPVIALLGRYLVEKELGKGAMGVVYLGKDPTIGRVVAIKTMALSDEFEGKELVDARERFFREAETAGRLQHQNIVTIFDAGEENHLAYIAMEFLKGKDLSHFCKQGQLLAVPTVLSIVARVAQALAYAHRQQVVHRDIKPANIMFEMESDTVKVTDFGIARITDASKTKTGLVLGTPSFMSPEQLAGKKVDGRSDLYSLGVMLFQMLSGVLPFRAQSLAELMSKIANEDAPDIRTLRKGLLPSLANLVAVSLHKRPEERYQDGDQLARDLRAVLSDLPALADEKTSARAAFVTDPKRPGDDAIDLEI